MNWKTTATTLAAALALAAPAFGDAAAIYAAKCAVCHGADGKGKKAIGTIDYSSPKGQAWSDAEGVKAILDGKGKMKAFKDKGVSEADAKALVAYVRKFKK